MTDIENGPDGALYVLSLTTGNIFRIGPKAGEFPDADVDGVNDRCDCDITESGAFAPPIEVPRLRLSLNGNLALGWDSQAAVAGDATGYTVVSGELSSLLLSDFAGACELASDLVAPQTVDARMDPPPGEGYYYLVRAANTCGSGGYGQGTLEPDPREALDALKLPSCP